MCRATIGVRGIGGAPDERGGCQSWGGKDSFTAVKDVLVAPGSDVNT
jgi:hypothetical protein